MDQVAFYGLSLNSPFLHNALFPSESSLTDGDTQAMYQTLRCTALRNVTVTIAGLIPGFWICFIFIDRLGRKPIQFMGFSVSTVVFVAMGQSFSPNFKSISFKFGYHQRLFIPKQNISRHLQHYTAFSTYSLTSAPIQSHSLYLQNRSPLVTAQPPTELLQLLGSLVPLLPK